MSSKQTESFAVSQGAQIQHVHVYQLGERNQQFYLKYLLATDFDATVAGLGLLLRKFRPQDLQFLHKVSLVFGHSQTLCLFRQLGRGQRLLRSPGTTLVLHLGWLTG